MEERLWSLDFMKGVSALFMVQAHVLETWTNQRIFETTAGQVIRFYNNTPAAVIFMVLMGFLISYTKASPNKLILRGIKVFFWGLLLNIGLNFHYLILLLLHPEYGNLWQSIFAVDILPLAGLSLIFIGLIKGININARAIIVIAAIIATITPWLNGWADRIAPDSYLMAYLAGTSDWSFFPLFPWLAYPLAGYWAGRVGLMTAGLRIMDKDQGQANNYLFGLLKKWGLFIVLAFISILGFLYNLSDVTDIHVFYHHGLLTFLWAMSFSFGMSILLAMMPGWRLGFFSLWVQFIGRYLTRFYVIQWLIIGNIATVIYQKLGFAGYLCGTIAVVFITSLIVYLIRDKIFWSPGINKAK